MAVCSPSLFPLCVPAPSPLVLAGVFFILKCSCSAAGCIGVWLCLLFGYRVCPCAVFVWFWYRVLDFVVVVFCFGLFGLT